ncbi:hypothetical protein L3Q82_005629 [Scortum barcoo]|uniref:Uncharacterized protein n=1 Tax=Scortum barcoo TaxID=214431 RepID=A0ACB8V629_9TELE|nr:hypothetical protein L3Q82_005629 [Scortum barcoo]
MASGGGSVASLWTEVNRCGQNGDFTRALKALTKILHENRDDVTALHCKIVCLIQNGSFKEALNVMNTHSKLLHGEVVFEKAYCEYRLNRVESALKTIEGAAEQTDKLKELYGQVLYRLERYNECKSVYTDLIRNSQDEYEEERKTNLAAVVASMSQWEDTPPDEVLYLLLQEDLGLPESTYELCYNAACALIGQGQLTEALNKLRQAEELCRVSLAEDSDVTEEDIESELAVIHSQMAYVMQLQGRTDEALQLYNQVIKLKPSDVGLLAVTANNIITINKDQNVFDSKKKVKLTNAEGVEYKLAKKQLQAIDLNKALLAMYTNQADQCRKLSSSLQSQNPGHPRPVLIKVAQLCREKQHGRAIELLQQFSDQHPESASGIKLTMAQLYLVQGHVTKACDVLGSIEEFKHKPGMISALVTMYSHEEDIDSAIDVFKQAIEHYQSEQPGSAAHLALVREAANFKLKYGRKKEAISDLEQLWKQNTNDIHTLAQLISAYSLVDTDKAKSLSKHLPSPDTMAFNVDVDELENSHGATYVRKKAAKVTGENLPKEQGQGDLKKKKKKKKGKLPKNYDPKATPDPERWLPMRERSYYRGKKKGKKKEQIGKGTQGATAGGSYSRAKTRKKKKDQTDFFDGPLTEDVEEMLARFQQTDSVRFEHFAAIWREMGLSGVFEGIPSIGERKRFCRITLATAMKYFLPPYSYQIRVGGLYLMFGFYHTQPVDPPVQIRLALKDWAPVQKFLKNSADSGHHDVVYIYQKLDAIRAIHYTAMPHLLTFQKQRKQKKEPVCAKFLGRTTAVQELMSADVLEELSNIESQYDNLKEAAVEVSTQVTVAHLDFTARLKDAMSEFLTWQQSTFSGESKKDKDQEKPEQAESSSRAKLLSSIKQKSYSSYQKAPKSRRHRQAETAESSGSGAEQVQEATMQRRRPPSLRARTWRSLGVTQEESNLQRWLLSAPPTEQQESVMVKRTNQKPR